MRCDVEGCAAQARCRGWCNHHYQSWYKYGDPLKAKRGHAGEANGRYRHGYAGSKLEFIWRQMVQRCHNPEHNRYADYGGRGIYVCDRWKDHFENFIFDVSGSYEEGLWFDRIDNDGPYAPDNFRWTTPSVSNQNRRTSGWENRSRDLEGRFK